MKIFPTNATFKGCRVWIECGKISVANSFNYKAEVDKPLIVFKKFAETQPIERAENDTETTRSGVNGT